ncbi:AAA family ATPase [Bifidobacterium bombi]|uniref:AAA+ domain protein n=1 Tax=Bifidobacterium bombi DSM 19703 TaxID=1341695 RepID=A0A086BNH0_9BIFI|nr:ATP-binding protein [Bifidobacterium bombi]KFF30484.1 AAA+ domain protein [Bifidobacterium bombi DSM 19703]
MLLDFSFSNFRSFRDAQSFSMMPSKKGSSPSTVTAIYGANASGKSNFLSAFAQMVTCVLQSYKQGISYKGGAKNAFALAADGGHGADEPTRFYIRFRACDGMEYEYRFSYQGSSVVDESLYVYRRIGERLSSRPSKLYSRDANGVEFGASFGAGGLLESTVSQRPDALVLSAAAAAGLEVTKPAFDFFRRISYCKASAFKVEQMRIVDQLSKHTEFGKNLSKLISYADFGIDGLSAQKETIDPILLSQIKGQLRKDLGVDESKFDQIFTDPAEVRLMFSHTKVGGKEVRFPAEQESDGTLGALSFFSLALSSLSEQSVVLVDEIDTSLHPSLVKEFVELFTDKETNPHNSQLIFTAHDVSLIMVYGSASRLLDPDQLWFVEKGMDGASEIFPASDLGVRKTENMGRNYLNGVYGAVPRPEFHELFAQILNEHETGADADTAYSDDGGDALVGMGIGGAL